MPLEAILLLIALTAALGSLFLELLPVDVTGLCLLLALMVSGIVPLNEAIAGFSTRERVRVVVAAASLIVLAIAASCGHSRSAFFAGRTSPQPDQAATD